MSLIPFEGAIEALLGVFNKYIPDVSAQAAARAEITTLMLNLSAQEDQNQSKIDEVEAAGNWFQSGWRPLIGWCCALTFSGHYVITPTFLFLRTCWQNVCVSPSYDLQEITTVLFALLGIGGMRTVDKGIITVMKALK